MSVVFIFYSKFQGEVLKFKEKFGSQKKELVTANFSKMTNISGYLEISKDTVFPGKMSYIVSFL